MAPPKKGQKMSLGDFLVDESLGSWADEMEDMPVASVPSGYGGSRQGGGYGSGGGDRFGSSSGGGFRSEREDRFPPREALPVPDKPPYTAHVGNLSFDVSEDEISDFFSRCEVTNIRLVRDKFEDRPKGFGYVEFGSKEGLIAALDLHGSQLSGRNVKISVAEPPKEREGDRMPTGEWRRAGPLPPLDNPPPRRGSERGDRFSEGGEGGGRRQSSYEHAPQRDFGNWERKGPLSPLAPTTPTGSDHGGRPRSGEREFSRRRSPAPSGDGAPRREFRERPQVERQPSAAEKDNAWRKGARPDAPERSAPSSPVLPQVRPKLELKKRSELPIDTGAATPSAESKSNPFGAAKPINTFQREQEIAEKRATAAAEKKARDEKAREEKKARTAATAERRESSATAEGDTPTGGKNFAMLRRTSASTAGGEGGSEAAGEASGDTPPEATEGEQKKEAKEASVRGAKKVVEERPRMPDNWRSRGPPSKEQPKAEADSDGWSTVAKPKRGRGPNGSNAVPAS